MSKDARNSTKLWAGGLTFMAIFWIGLRLDLPKGLRDEVPAGWLWLGMGILAVLNLGQIGWGFWQRRASNVDNPNRR
jgi:hypothetical protein